ncbi:uncharacterized protein [Engystomops pustulosus]|uniref:uncharacterized protein n=1 Tax=Engystomops pustulosus TaxID=76066 RepID=UPI003AFB18B6
MAGSHLLGLLSQEIQVFQVPELHTRAGCDVTLPCTYSLSGVEEVTAGFSKWYRHVVSSGSEVLDDTEGFTGRIFRANTEQFIQKREAQITIRNTDTTDTAMYYCRVSFITLNVSVEGNGTFLNVTDAVTRGSWDHLSLSVSLGVVSVVALLLLVVASYRISKREPRSRQEESHIVYSDYSAPVAGVEQCGSRGRPELQNMEISPYMIENQQYNQFLPEDNQLVNLYSVIP